MSRADELVTAVGLAREREMHAEVDEQAARAALHRAENHTKICRGERNRAERELLVFTGKHDYESPAAASAPFGFLEDFMARVDRLADFPLTAAAD